MGNFASINHFCFSCLASFNRKSRLDNHKLICQKYKPSIAVLPDEQNKKLFFKLTEKTMKFPFVIYVDFKCILIKNNVKMSQKTNIYQIHEPVSYCVIFI